MPVKRIVLGQLWQEQNTFSPVKTVLEDFEQFGLYYGDEIIERFSGVNELGGFITALNARKDTRIIPSIRAWSWPKGNVSPVTYKFLKDEIIGRIRKAMPLEGVLFSFHGAMVSDSQFDVEGDILKSIREETGMDIPVAISCDLHANITHDMLKYADYIEGYHTCPHVDLFRTGKKAALIFSELLDGARLDTGFVKLPLITPARAHDSSRHPFKTLFGWLEEIEKEPGIKGASLFPVQPWLDVPQLGWSVIVYAEKGCADPQAAAEKLAKRAWDIKDDFFLDELTPEQAIEDAGRMEKGLMVVSDSDATTAGAPGDNSIMLEAVQKAAPGFPVLLCFIDPDIIKACVKAGKGNKISGLIGGKMDNIYSSPVSISGTVTDIVDGRFEIDGHIGKNYFDMGRMAVIQDGNINILVAEKNGPFYEPTVYRNAGLDPLDYRMLVVKSPVGFRYAFEDMADSIGMIQHPGLSSSDLGLFDFKNIPRPLYPLDSIKELKI